MAHWGVRLRKESDTTEWPNNHSSRSPLRWPLLGYPPCTDEANEVPGDWLPCPWPQRAMNSARRKFLSSLPQTLVEHQDRKCAVCIQVPPTDSCGLPLVSLGRDGGCSNKWVYVGQHRIGGWVKAACGVAPASGHQWSGHPSPLSGPQYLMMTHQRPVEAGLAASSLHSCPRRGIRSAYNGEEECASNCFPSQLHLLFLLSKLPKTCLSCQCEKHSSREEG